MSATCAGLTNAQTCGDKIILEIKNQPRPPRRGTPGRSRARWGDPLRSSRRPLVDVVGKATLRARTLGAISLQLSGCTLGKATLLAPEPPAFMPACTHWPFAAPRRLWQRLLSDPGRPRLSPHVLFHTCRHIRLRLDPPLDSTPRPPTGASQAFLAWGREAPTRTVEGAREQRARLRMPRSFVRSEWP